MNLIDYNKAIEALDKERQLLLNREQYGAENVLVHHAINVIAELPIVRQPEIVRCKDCKYGEKINQVHGDDVMYLCYSPVLSSAKCVHLHGADWFCADGKRKEGW